MGPPKVVWVPLSTEDRKLVKESVAHWERMRDDPECGERPVAEQCALCDGYQDCEDGCPVFRARGGCPGTPFTRAEQFWSIWRKQGWTPAALGKWKCLAQAEIDFLKSLLED